MKAVVLIFIVFICGSIAYDSYIGNAKSDSNCLYFKYFVLLLKKKLNFFSSPK